MAKNETKCSEVLKCPCAWTLWKRFLNESGRFFVDERINEELAEFDLQLVELGE